ncbi:hypothetical protein SLS56_005741 [Neofusicoccum ribis]|uniref:Heterokaryon incompatibility domain-containing protein n=1 Tax=Neofusicoccum ribis TaxID=45134 RepID=A0ABR3SSP4_9PEZI
MRYTALSYSWKGSVFTDAEIEHEDDDDTPEPFHEIECDDRSRMVGENLFQALLQISKSNVRYLWVDALCINQRDFIERESQVLLMGDIYALASRVIVWLGCESTDLREFVWLHTKFMPALDWLIDNHTTAVLQRSPLDNIFREGSGFSVTDWYQYWWAYFRFFRRRRWFYRAWVVQEVALAGKIDVFISDVVLPWDSVSGLARFVMCSGWGLVLAPPRQIRKDAGLGEMESMWLMREVYQAGATWSNSAQGLRKGLEKVFGATTEEQLWYVFVIWAIDMVRKQRATNPRDHIYAILGIAERFIPLGIARLIVPCYSAKPEDIYMDVASVFLRKLPFLSLLSMLEDRSERALSSLPSWVPDWSVPGSTPVRIGWANHDGVPQFDATCVDRLEQPSCWIDGPRLLLQGACFDSVVEVSDPLITVMTDYRAASIFKLCSGMRQMYLPTGQTRQEALWRTLVLDELDNNYPALQRSSSQFRDWARMISAAGLYLCGKDEEARARLLEDISCLDELARDEGSLLLSSSKVRDEAQSLARVLDNVELDNENEWGTFTKDFDGESMQFASRLGCTGASRRLYRTARGFVGLGPQSLRKGDQVWMVLGARVPFVFRRNLTRPGLTLLGETYLHGFMHGAMRDLVGDDTEEFAVV